MKVERIRLTEDRFDDLYNRYKKLAMNAGIKLDEAELYADLKASKETGETKLDSTTDELIKEFEDKIKLNKQIKALKSANTRKLSALDAQAKADLEAADKAASDEATAKADKLAEDSVRGKYEASALDALKQGDKSVLINRLKRVGFSNTEGKLNRYSPLHLTSFLSSFGELNLDNKNDLFLNVLNSNNSNNVFRGDPQLFAKAYNYLVYAERQNKLNYLNDKAYLSKPLAVVYNPNFYTKVANNTDMNKLVEYNKTHQGEDSMKAVNDSIQSNKYKTITDRVQGQDNDADVQEVKDLIKRFTPDQVQQLKDMLNKLK